MNDHKSIYHGGPISGLTAEAASERRLYFAKALYPHIEVISPMRWKEFLREKGVLNHRNKLDQHPITADPGVVARDTFDVRRSTMMLADFEFPAKREVMVYAPEQKAFVEERMELASGGTFAEVGAAYVLNKPICTILKPGGVHDHPFIRGMSGWIVTSLDEAIDVVRSVLLSDWPVEHWEREEQPVRRSSLEAGVAPARFRE